MSAALPRSTRRQRRRASPLAALLVLTSRALLGAAAQPDLDLDRPQRRRGSRDPRQRRSRRPAVDGASQARGRGRRSADSDLGRAQGLRDRARVRAERRELQEARGARRRPRRPVRADDQADLLHADASSTFSGSTTRRTRASTCNRVSGPIAHMEGSWWLLPQDNGRILLVYELALDPGMPIPRFLVRATLKRDLPKVMSAVRERAEAAGREVTGEPRSRVRCGRRLWTSAKSHVVHGVEQRCDSGHRDAVAELLRFRGCGTLPRQRAAHPDPGARQQGPLHAAALRRQRLARRRRAVDVRHADDALGDPERLKSFDVLLVGCDFSQDGTAENPTLQALRAVAADPSNPAVILLTTKGSEYTAVQAIKSGAFDYVPKTLLGREQVLSAVQRAMLHRKGLLGTRGSTVTGVVRLFGYDMRRCLATRDSVSVHVAFSARARQGSRAEGAAPRPRRACRATRTSSASSRSSSCSTTSTITPSPRSTTSASRASTATSRWSTFRSGTWARSSTTRLAPAEALHYAREIAHGALDHSHRRRHPPRLEARQHHAARRRQRRADRLRHLALGACRNEREPGRRDARDRGHAVLHEPRASGRRRRRTSARTSTRSA